MCWRRSPGPSDALDGHKKAAGHGRIWLNTLPISLHCLPERIKHGLGLTQAPIPPPDYTASIRQKRYSRSGIGNVRKCAWCFNGRNVQQREVREGGVMISSFVRSKREVDRSLASASATASGITVVKRVAYLWPSVVIVVGFIITIAWIGGLLWLLRLAVSSLLR